MLNRRTLLRHVAVLSTGNALSRVALGLVAPDAIPLRTSGAAPSQLPADFMGLGYEMSSVAPLGLLSVTNNRYVQLIRQLGSRGVLRVGGIVADYTRYDPNGVPKADMHDTVITRQALEQFGGFLKKVGWTAIWSVNFAQGTIADAVTEATAVSEVLGSSLQALEIGNEVENYARGRTFRKVPYTYEQYRAEYSEWRAAILKAVLNARFAAPDTASSVEWVESMAQDAHGDVQLLTTHYYRNGQKQGSADQLTHADPRLLERMVRLRTASQQSGIPWRVCETNSFSGGGLPGVSNTLLGALWTLDFMAILAKYGCAGVNIETGVNQLGFVSSYSPIQDDGHANNTAGAPYYGMLAFAVARAGCSQGVALEMVADEPDVTAYAFGKEGNVRSVVLVNRSLRSQHPSIATLGMHNGTVIRLNGPSPNSTTDIQLGGTTVDANGRWSAITQERLRDARLALPPMSAAVVRREPKRGASTLNV